MKIETGCNSWIVKAIRKIKLVMEIVLNFNMSSFVYFCNHELSSRLARQNFTITQIALESSNILLAGSVAGGQGGVETTPEDLACRSGPWWFRITGWRSVSVWAWRNPWLMWADCDSSISDTRAKIEKRAPLRHSLSSHWNDRSLECFVNTPRLELVAFTLDNISSFKPNPSWSLDIM